jgi:hypothetical protein
MIRVAIGMIFAAYAYYIFSAPSLVSVPSDPRVSAPIRGYIIWFFICKKGFNGMLNCQVKFASVLEQKVVKSFFLELSRKCGANKAIVAGDEDFGGGVHF